PRGPGPGPGARPECAGGRQRHGVLTKARGGQDHEAEEEGGRCTHPAPGHRALSAPLLAARAGAPRGQPGRRPAPDGRRAGPSALAHAPWLGTAGGARLPGGRGRAGRLRGGHAAAPDALGALRLPALPAGQGQEALPAAHQSAAEVRGARVRRVFLLGIPRGRAGAQAQEGLLRAEGLAYGDILLWAFDDTFFNLTLKEIHFLDWASAFCPDARFVFKGDDDVFVHMENLLEFVATRDPSQDLLAGDVILQARPIRARESKYYIPEGVYGLGAYPAYAGGGGFVLSGATLRRLAAACAQVELFPIDDVFLGMCLQRLRLAPEPHQAFRTFGIERPSAAPHLRTFDPCFYRELVLVHGLSAADIWLMWQMLHAVPGPDCARRRTAPKPFRWGS
uniref:Hexosyltransferase n=1 Tax=Sarcophilus harrisii TaxID=9305 RepID=A0A7N4PJC9_SARHA